MGNAVTWFEVVGNDTEALGRFYGELFDWKLEPMAEMPYTIADPGADNGLRGGIGPDPTVVRDTSLSTSTQMTSRARWPVPRSSAGAGSLVRSRSRGSQIGLFSDPEGHVVGLIQQK